jgi:hypothetical protein
MVSSETDALSGVAGRRGPTVVTTPTEDVVTMLCGLLLVTGMMTDAWAHSNLLGQLQREGFITPWHVVLYGGFTCSAVWTVALRFRHRPSAQQGLAEGWPAGYGLGALGVLIFGIAGVCDGLWHTVFGVEAGLAAILSPSHLLLGVGAVLVLTSPLRSWWATGDRRRAVPGVVGLALATTITSAFLLYVSAFQVTDPTLPFDDSTDAGFTDAALGLARYLVTTVILVVPLLLVHQRRPVPGAATALVFFVTLFPLVIHEFPDPNTAGAVGALLGAVVTDVALLRAGALGRRDAPWRLPVVAMGFTILVWSLNLLALQLAAGIRWDVELWTGILFQTGALAAALGGLAAFGGRERVGDSGSGSR